MYQAKWLIHPALLWGSCLLLVKLSDLLAHQEMFPASIAILVWSRCNCAGLLEKYVLQREKKFSSGPVLPSYRRKSLSQAIGYLFQGLG